MSLTYEQCVRLGLEVKEKQENLNWEYGDLALQVPKKYGENTLQHFADDVGIVFETMKSYRSVSAAFPKQNGIRIPVCSWAVHQILMAQSDRLELVKKRMTVEEARKLVEKRKKATESVRLIYETLDSLAQSAIARAEEFSNHLEDLRSKELELTKDQIETLTYQRQKVVNLWTEIEITVQERSHLKIVG